VRLRHVARNNTRHHSSFGGGWRVSKLELQPLVGIRPLRRIGPIAHHYYRSDADRTNVNLSSASMPGSQTKERKMNDYAKHSPVSEAKHSPASEDVSSDLKQLRDDFSRLSDSVADLVKAQTNSASGAIRDGVANIGGAIADKAQGLSSSAVQMTNSAQETMRSASHDIEASIERNPLTAVMIAAGIGMVLGMVSARG
jgi:ElaB/YqjD/DUF883 family membrane-anchored ribosome-binding protein